MQNYKTEYEILFSCFCKKTSMQKLKSLFAQAHCVHWQTLIETGYKHRLLPLLYYHLKLCGLLEKIPAEHSLTLFNAYHHSLARGIRLTSAYQEIRDMLGGAGIEFIPLRGIDHITTLYENNPALRPMDDIDLLVSPHNLEKTRVLFKSSALKKIELRSDVNHHDKYVYKTANFEIHHQLLSSGTLNLFPEFHIDTFTNNIHALCKRPLCAVHYFIHAQKPAIRICDYMRLPSHKSGLSFETTFVMNKIDKIIRLAQNGNYQSIFNNESGYKSFWISYSARIFLHYLTQNPKRSFYFFKNIIQWRLHRKNAIKNETAPAS